MKNIFIVGPVASGKNTLLEKIKYDYDVIALDTGRIYRYVTWKIYEQIKNDIDINLILDGDSNEIDKARNHIFRLSKYYDKQLSNLKFTSNNLFEGGIQVDENNLYSRETNALISIVAGISTVRSRINQFIKDSISISEKPIIMTGHNINEIDTTKFLVVYLDVDSKISAHRLYNRNINSYNDVLDAYSEVERRNKNDKMAYTKNIIPYLYASIYIDSSNKSIDEMYNEFRDKANYFENEEINFILTQEKSIKRDDFEWLFNNALNPIKKVLEKISENLVKDYPFINKSDLIYQTIILLTSHTYKEIFTCDEEFETLINDSIINRQNIPLSFINQKINNNELIINNELLINLMNTALLQLLDLYKDDVVKEILENYNKNDHSTKIEKKNGAFIKSNDSNNEVLDYREIDHETSKFISKYCHYLHTPREDEFVSYGVFTKDNELPIAYVSFSRHDREYKKELLYNVGIEPQNTLEMTRAWCSNSAPANIMSALFQYSINEISSKWKEMKKQGLVDSNLQAITTTINPNLGFKASSFLGCNFIPLALRPAKFTFVKKDGIIKYTTRRGINPGDEYFENKIEILPLNELIHCIDFNKEKEILEKNIFIIGESTYEKVLKKKEKGKAKKYEKDINSN